DPSTIPFTCAPLASIPTVAPPYDHHRMAHYPEDMSSDFVKQRQAAPEGFFAAEAAGLRWLADPAAVPVVEVVDHGEDCLRFRLVPGSSGVLRSPRCPVRGLDRLGDVLLRVLDRWAPVTAAVCRRGGPLDRGDSHHRLGGGGDRGRCVRRNQR